jgi:hypothetical protein
VEESKKDARSAKIFAWVGTGIGIVGLIVAIIALFI